MEKDMSMLKEKIVNWIKDKVAEAGAKGAVVGLSGGVDSSVVAVLAKQALGENVLGVIMPCESKGEDMEHAKMLAEKFGIRTEMVDLGQTFRSLKGSLPPGEGVAVANLKPRLRMTTLYYFANLHDCLVLGTDNRVESVLGYFTKHGDGGVDILPISGLLKGEVREMARHLGVPEAIITKHPSAGLWSGQTDEGEMGITYDELDSIITAMKKGETGGIDPRKLEKVKDMIRKSEHKRRSPDALEL